MTENEIIKHAKKVYTVFQSAGIGIKDKLKDIVIEIVIIVFAVSISIWFHNWSESIHDHGEEIEFLTGLKQDLQSDIDNMEGSRDFYITTVQGIRYFLNSSKGGSLQKDSIMKYSSVFFSSTDLDPHVGRYEGLKSSGKFKIVRNKELLNTIIDFHETLVQRIQVLDEKYYQHKEKLEAVVEQHVELSKDGSIRNAGQVLKRSDVRILLELSGGLITNNIIGVHDRGIKKCHDIMSQIDKEIKD
jgi:hypothetical protein